MGQNQTASGAAEELLAIIMHRYEPSQHVEDWGKLLGDAKDRSQSVEPLAP
jgi:hypothetical protein